MPAHRFASLFRAATLPCVVLLLCLPLSGCMVAGWSTSGGGYMFPGSIFGVFVLAAILWFLLRRR